jgi:hypothetical protein
MLRPGEGLVVGSGLGLALGLELGLGLGVGVEVGLGLGLAPEFGLGLGAGSESPPPPHAATANASAAIISTLNARRIVPFNEIALFVMPCLLVSSRAMDSALPLIESRMLMKQNYIVNEKRLSFTTCISVTH